MSRYIEKVWEDALDVPYVCPQPGIRYYNDFQNHAPRADRGASADQPWYHGANFKEFDNTKDLVAKRRGRS